MEPGGNGGGAPVAALPPIEQAGPGATVVAVGIRNGEVTLQFPHRVGWVSLDPATAVLVAEAMARAGFQIRNGRPPRDNVDVLHGEIKRRAIDSVRQTMITRCTIILRQLLERGRKPEYMAAEVVDRILQEVT